MKPSGWTFQSPPNRGEPTKPLVSATGDADPLKSSLEPDGSAAAEKTAEEDANSRINRILRIVKSDPKEASDDERGKGAGGRDRNRRNRGDRRGQQQNDQRGGGGGRRGGGNAADFDGADGTRSRNRRGGRQNKEADGHGDKREAGTDSKLNPNAPVFNFMPEAGEVPGADAAAGAFALGSGDYAEDGFDCGRGVTFNNEGFYEPDQYRGGYPSAAVGQGGVKPGLLGAAPDFPEVILGERENEFIGLVAVAEMGDWVVLRENKPNCLPFFWHRMTGAKSWEPPPNINSTGVAELLKKYAIKMPVKRDDDSSRNRGFDGPYVEDASHDGPHLLRGMGRGRGGPLRGPPPMMGGDGSRSAPSRGGDMRHGGRSGYYSDDGEEPAYGEAPSKGKSKGKGDGLKGKGRDGSPVEDQGRGGRAAAGIRRDGQSRKGQQEDPGGTASKQSSRKGGGGAQWQPKGDGDASADGRSRGRAGRRKEDSVSKESGPTWKPKEAGPAD